MKRALRRVGLDWGSESHQVCRIDGEEEPKQRSFPHTSEGLRALVAFVIEGEMDPECSLRCLARSSETPVRRTPRTKPGRRRHADRPWLPAWKTDRAVDPAISD